MTCDAPVRRALELLGPLARAGVALGPLTTYRVGGPAAVFVVADTEADLVRTSYAVRETGLPVLVVGKGSNMLVADRGFAGVAVVLGDGFAGIDTTPVPPGGALVRAGGAVALPVLARRTAAAGLGGLEWAVGVPGSVGGAVRMNAGGHGSDVAASLQRVRVLDLRTGEDGVMPAGLLDLAYRSSRLAPSQVVVWAEFALAEGDPARSGRLVDEVVAWRRANQPGGHNAGSVFTNPPGDTAGRLVDACGLKGLRIGTAEVSAKHANFIQADDGGRADDVYALIAAVRDRVHAATGVWLHTELRLVGFDPPAGAPQ